MVNFALINKFMIEFQSYYVKHPSMHISLHQYLQFSYPTPHISASSLGTDISLPFVLPIFFLLDTDLHVATEGVLYISPYLFFRPSSYPE